MENPQEKETKGLNMSENEQVELVFLKFGLAQTDSEFEVLVDKFLPNILGKVASQNEGIRNKVIQLLTHISNRLKTRSEVRLPIMRLLKLYQESKSVFVVNFTIIYLKLGFPRLSSTEQAEIAPQLFAALEGKPKSHQDSLIRILIATFPHIKLPENPELRTELFKFQDHLNTTKSVLDFCLDVLLMPYSVIPHAEPQTRPATAPVGGAAANQVVAPPGLNASGVKRLGGDVAEQSWSIKQIEQFKVGILNLISGDLFPETSIIIHLIVASSDTRHTVSTNADLELKKRQRSLNWDDASLNTSLYRLYLGEASTLTAAQRKQKPHPATLRKPVDLRVKLKIVQNLLRSKSATERFPYTIQLVYDVLFAVGTNQRLKTLGLEFAHHICERCDKPKLLPQGPLLLKAMLKVSEDTESSPQIRGLGHTAMGKLSTRVPDLFSNDLKLIQDLFEALSKETSQELKLYIQESLAMMSQAYAKVTTEHLPLVEALITKYITDPDHLCRLSAVRYAGLIFPSHHVSSRYLLLLAASDVKEDVAAEAKKLLYGGDSSVQKTNKTKEQSIKLPTFSDMINYVYIKAQERVKSSQRFLVGSQSIPFAPSTFLVLLQYLRKCLLTDAMKEVSSRTIIFGEMKTEAPVISEYIRINTKDGSMTTLLSKYLELIIQFARAVTDVDAVYILLEAFAVCPDDIPMGTLIKDGLENRLEWIKSLAHHTRESIREYGSELYALILKRSQDVDQEKIVSELLKNIKSEKNYEAKHGSLLVLGYLLGDWIVAYQDEMIPQVFGDALQCVVESAISRDTTIASASCFSIGEIARKSQLPIDDGVVSTKDDEKDKDDKEKIKIDKNYTKADVLRVLLSHVKSSTAHRLRERSVIALGCLPVGDKDFVHKEFLLESLLESAEIKEADLHFTVARSLCNIALGPMSSPAQNRWHLKNKRSDLNGDFDETKITWLIEKILSEYVNHRIPAVRQAASIWLLTMLKTDEITSNPSLQQFLSSIQSAFMSLLTEGDDLVQDVASKGLGVVYELGTDERKKMLVDGLVGSLMEGNSSKSVKPNQENLFHGVKGLGKAPDGSKLTTYKEICSLASDLNQPDLVYKFLHLAKHHALWNSKKGAAFGFSNIASLASEQLAPHLPKIVPRLYRYTFDPQPGVRSAMTSIWNALATDPKKLVDDYLEAITEDLKKNLASSLWRTRQASCLAVADLLRGGRGMKGSKEGDIIIGALPELWVASLRVMDDIKETVRDAATVASKALKKTTIKLCEYDQGKLGEKAVENILPVLLKDGLSSRVKEVKSLCLNTLVEVSKKSGKLIKGCIPQMVVTLLEALSEFEPATINYLSVRSDQTDRDMIDLARAQAAKSSPMVETIDRVLQHADKGTLEQLVPYLTDMTKKNYGIMTKAGCSHVAIMLVTHCKDDVSHFAPTIISSFMSGLADNSLAVRKCNAEAIGHLAKVAKSSTISKTFGKLKDCYLEKEDDIHHHASAVACHCIGKHSPDVLNAHATVALPLAFLGKHEAIVDKNGKVDEKAGISKKEDKNSPKFLWNDIWNEFTPGSASAIKLYLDELITFTSAALQSSQWKMKAQAAAAMATIARQQREGTIAGAQLHKLVEILLHGLQGRTWDGKEKLLVALSAVAVHCKSQLTMEEVSRILSVLFKECSREKLVYKTEAIHSLGAVLEAHQVDKFELFWGILNPILKRDSKDDSEDSDDEGGENKKNASTAKLNLLENAIEACGRAWPKEIKTQDQFFVEVGKILTEHITLSTWNIQLAALRAVKLIFRMLVKSKTEDMEVDGTETTEESRGRYLDVESTKLLDAVCTSLGNAKYSRIREEALVLAQLINTLFQGKTFNLAGIDKLITALEESPLSEKRCNKKTTVDELIKKLSAQRKDT